MKVNAGIPPRKTRELTNWDSQTSVNNKCNSFLLVLTDVRVKGCHSKCEILGHLRKMY